MLRCSVNDGDGGRVKQITASGTTTFLGESYELASDGTATKYLFADSQRLAARTSTGELHFYHGDHLGSSNIVTDNSGQLVELAEYSPYGSLARREGAVEVAHKFTGHRQDAVNGLVFAQARYYDPSLGRFISADPTVQSPDDPQDLNRYAYARNNPINLVDPSGYGWLRQLINVVVAIVLMVLVPYLEIPWLIATAFSAGVSAAADQQGKAIERSISSNSQQASAPTLQQNAGRMWTSFATNPAVSNTASIASGFLPGAGEAQDFAAAVYGVDIITGEQLAPWEQNISRVALFVPFFGGVHARHGVRALNKVIESGHQTGPLQKAFRYFGRKEANEVSKLKRIPNVNIKGEAKEVLLTPTRYKSTAQAEKALQAGRLHPSGPQEALEFGAEVDLRGIELRRANSIENGTDIEIGTYGSPRVRRLFRLDD